MQITDITEKYVPFGSGLPRTSGVHLTQVIRSLQETLGLAKHAEGWNMDAAADIGFLWEEAFSAAYRDKVLGSPDGAFITRPPELIEDGIMFSPDGIGPDPITGDVADHEYKFTWRSSRRQPGDDFYWDTQFKCYCRGMGTRIAILHVMYCVGDYRGSGPTPKTYRMEYTKQEVDTAWGMVTKHAKEKGWI